MILITEKDDRLVDITKEYKTLQGAKCALTWLLKNYNTGPQYYARHNRTASLVSDHDFMDVCFCKEKNQFVRYLRWQHYNGANEMTGAAKIKKIIDIIKSGKIVFFTTALKSYAVNKKTLNKFENLGCKLFKTNANNEILMRSGGAYLCMDGSQSYICMDGFHVTFV